VTSRHLVDPELLPFVDSAPDFVLNHDTLPLLRARQPLPQPEAPAGISLKRVSITSADDQPIMLHIYRPTSTAGALPAIYHMHGGGLISGSATRVEARHRAQAHHLNCTIISVDYRLAPEWRFPTAIEDCYAGLAWLMDNAEKLGIDIGRIGVMGESAGGGLATALALLVRDRGEYRLAFQHLIYPMLDDRTGRQPGNPFAGEFVWTAAHNIFAWDAYLGPDVAGTSSVSHYAAAARAKSLVELPPTFLATGELDLFVDENTDYARRLDEAGIATEFHIFAGAVHGFDAVTEVSIARQLRAICQAALNRALDDPRL
jgi:acetyl esterase/lipase